MKILLGVMTTLSTIVAVFNFFGGIVGLIWLFAIRDWRVAGGSILAFFVGAAAVSLVMAPSPLLVAGAAAFADRGRLGAIAVMAVLSNLYVSIAITLWDMAVLYLFVNHADGHNLVPRLLVSYSVATGPWSYLASKNGPQNQNEIMLVFFQQIAYILVMVLIGVFSSAFHTAIIVFASIEALACGVLIISGILTIQEAARQRLLENPFGVPRAAE